MAIESTVNRRIIYKEIAVGLIRRGFANGPGHWGSIPGRVIPKTPKMLFDTALLNTQHYKVRIKVEQSREWSSAPPEHLNVVAIKKGAYGTHMTGFADVTYFTYFFTGESVSFTP